MELSLIKLKIGDGRGQDKYIRVKINFIYKATT